MISDSRVQLSARLQKHFGLRREEAIKFVVNYADRGTHIHLKAAWCKGGRERKVPITTIEQAGLLNSIRLLVGNASLIPGHLKYIQHLRVFEREMNSVGLGRTHGARHMYAQKRYEQLTMEIQRRTRPSIKMFKAPANGGLKPSQMIPEDKEIDRQARQMISRELGHERLHVTSLYLGG